jgi:hypothetical protein
MRPFVVRSLAGKLEWLTRSDKLKKIIRQTNKKSLMASSLLRDMITDAMWKTDEILTELVLVYSECDDSAIEEAHTLVQQDLAALWQKLRSLRGSE